MCYADGADSPLSHQCHQVRWYNKWYSALWTGN